MYYFRHLFSFLFVAINIIAVIILFVPLPQESGALGSFDIVIHLCLFATLAAISLLRFSPREVVVVFLLGCYAIGSELVQGTFIPGRYFDPQDIAVDYLGIMVGSFAYHWVHARWGSLLRVNK